MLFLDKGVEILQIRGSDSSPVPCIIVIYRSSIIRTWVSVLCAQSSFVGHTLQYMMSILLVEGHMSQAWLGRINCESFGPACSVDPMVSN